jgi:outer membrane receptor for ferrienterochelin and colicins
MIAPTKIAGDTADDRVTEAFVRDAWNAGSWLAVAGARTTSSSVWGSAATPTVGIAWQARPALRLRADVASGFRAPSFKEIRYTFANPGAGYMVQGNPDLEPERSLNASAGASWAPTPSVTVDAEAYRNDVSKLIDTRLTGTNAAGLQVYENVNVAEARLEGIEVSARARAGRTEASVGFSWLRAVDRESGAPLEGHAARSGLARVTRTWGGHSAVTTDLAVRYTGPARLGTDTRGAMLAVDGQIRTRLTSTLEWSVGVDNLFNAQPDLWTTAFQRQVYAGLRMVVHPLD